MLAVSLITSTEDGKCYAANKPLSEPLRNNVIPLSAAQPNPQSRTQCPGITIGFVCQEKRCLNLGTLEQDVLHDG